VFSASILVDGGFQSSQLPVDLDGGFESFHPQLTQMVDFSVFIFKLS
jgi:hypothetical protein